ncbi:reverse transcriptase [Phytophthora megakarya]|uniref:Reverse transcriptase n=1 Tax=Phytophthora megakarya TaxID=4795 RepID=A0A225VZY5_9STRA|nr:reverse transcriptase [Phytophthora megakarya]
MKISNAVIKGFTESKSVYAENSIGSGCTGILSVSCKNVKAVSLPRVHHRILDHHLSSSFVNQCVILPRKKSQKPTWSDNLARHDRDLKFMSEVFTRFREMLESKQRAALAYRPQPNGQQERSVWTVTRAIRAYVEESDQSDWDDQVEKSMWALNTSFDATRLDTPFYLVDGTPSAMLGKILTGFDQKAAYEWRRNTQRQYEYAQALAKDRQSEVKSKRSMVQPQI